MCGLVGVMGHIGLKEKDVLKQLLVVDVLRGKHSTGIAAVNYAGGVSVVKKAVNGVDFLDMKPAVTALASTLNCIIGHNRYATKGAVNNTNAHPFEFDNVVGAHNGTLRSTWNLDKSNVFAVDSECLYNHINDNGIDSAFDKAVGAYALTWFDKAQQTLQFLRNNERPLCYCFSEDYRTLFWASESWMLIGILWRNSIDHTDIIVTREDTLYEFAVPKGVVGVKERLTPPKVRLLKRTIKPVKKLQNSALKCINGGKQTGMTTTTITNQRTTMMPYVGETVVMFVNRTAYDDNNQRYVDCCLEEDIDISIRVYLAPSDTRWATMVTSVNSFTCHIRAYKIYKGSEYLLADLRTVKELEYNLDAVNGEVDGEDVTVDGYNGEKLTYTQFSKATSEGCAWCTGNGTFGQPTVFISPFDFFCHTCLKDKECKEYLEGVGK
jgi:predicted glutamine amidotransferase